MLSVGGREDPRKAYTSPSGNSDISTRGDPSGVSCLLAWDSDLGLGMLPRISQPTTPSPAPPPPLGPTAWDLFQGLVDDFILSSSPISAGDVQSHMTWASRAGHHHGNETLGI